MRVWLVLVTLLIAGCTTSQAPETQEPVDAVPEQPPLPPGQEDVEPRREAEFSGNETLPSGNQTNPPTWTPTVVVADVSSGFNPYHEAHRRDAWPHPCLRVVGLPCTMPVLNITLGDDFTAAREADAPVWEALAPGEPVWINGTNIIFEYQRLNGDNPVAFDPGDHGTATLGAVNEACPECYVFAYQDQQSLDGEPVRALAEYPWVDLVVSTNWPGNQARTIGHLTDGPYAEATRGLHAAGGIFFGAAGNHPVTGLLVLSLPFPYHPIMLPPWVALVSGHRDACGGRAVASGQLTEFTAEYVQTLPRSGSIDGRSTYAGTSFSAPKAAGLWADVLRQVHTAFPPESAEALWQGPPGHGLLEDGRLSQEELRSVMAEAAILYGPSDFDSGCAGQWGGTRPVTEPGPWDNGWGNLEAGAVDLAIGLLRDGEPLVPKSDELRATMEAFQDARAVVYRW